MSQHHHRGQWGTRAGFILAAIGSAVGLGNIWRFPYMVASNGGGAFMIVFLLAMLTAGIPIMILEFSIGHKTHKSALRCFESIESFLGMVRLVTSIYMFCNSYLLFSYYCLVIILRTLFYSRFKMGN
ncbi:hypothetical protein OFP58_06465 [Brachyspira hyodysenteriae]|nr:hypothetical protein [Brachyspira hyodysenteriae]